MASLSLKKVYLYTKFERFWHWTQAFLIILLGLTGFEIHGAYTLWGFGEAVDWHNGLGTAWLVLFVFILFWEFTTGEWKHYIPTTQKLLTVVRYYGYGIFKGEDHPFPKSERAKHNPLQRLTYLGIAVILIPLQMGTGFLYYFYNSWPEWGLGLSLETVALLHTAGAFLLFIFLIVHVYMTTTGHSLTGHLKAMFTGWEEVPVDRAAEPN